MLYQAISPAPTLHKDFTQHIAAYTSGTISNKSNITIQLSSAPENQVDSQALERLFSFSPSMPGTVTWADERTITLKPTQALPAGKKFKAKFYLSRPKKVPGQLKTFSFQFPTIEQAFHVAIEGLQAHNPNEPATMQLKGSLTTADFASNEKIEQVLSATQRDKKLPIQWKHQPIASSTSLQSPISNAPKVPTSR